MKREKWAVEIINTYLLDGTGMAGELVSAGQVEIYRAPNEYASAEEAARAAALRTGVYEHRIINARPIKLEESNTTIRKPGLVTSRLSAGLPRFRQIIINRRNKKGTDNS